MSTSSSLVVDVDRFFKFTFPTKAFNTCLRANNKFCINLAKALSLLIIPASSLSASNCIAVTIASSLNLGVSSFNSGYLFLTCFIASNPVAD